MHKRTLTAVILACMTSIPQHTNAQVNSSKQIAISIKLCEKATESSPKRILADPTIVATVGRTFTMHSGGTVKPRVGEGELEFGTQVTGRLNQSGDHMMQVDLKISVGTHKQSDAKTDVVLAETLEIRTILKPETTKRLDYSQLRWCELRIEEVDIPPLGKGKAKLSEGDILTVMFSEQEALMLRGGQKVKLLGSLESSPYRMAVKVTGIRPYGVCEIESHQKTRQDDVLREVSLTGLIQAKSVSDKRTVQINEVANLDVDVRVFKPKN